MSECRVRESCDSSAMITEITSPLPAATSAGSGLSPVSGDGVDDRFFECLRLRDDLHNTRRLLPVLATVTVAGAAATLWTGLSASDAQVARPPSAKPKSAASEMVTLLAGIITVGVGGWGAYEHWRYLQLPNAYASLHCDEVFIKVKKIAPEPLEMESWEEIPTGLYEPPRRLSVGSELPAEAPAQLAAEPHRRGWADRLGAAAMAGVALVGLAWVVGNDLHPAGSSDDHMIAVYWNRLFQSARFVFN